MTAVIDLAPSRRRTLRWMLAAAASPLLADCAPLPSGRAGFIDPAVGRPAPWPALDLAPIGAPGYGRDPDLASPTTPWPLTLDRRQRETVAVACDLIVGVDEGATPPSALGVPDFVDEWVSAPYPRQRDDRAVILPGLAWLDAECARRFGATFAAASDANRRAVFDTIAYRDRIGEGFEAPADFFRRLKGLAFGGYYTLPEGHADIGYIGDTPILGPYPGPSDEALAHLEAHLDSLGLTMPDDV